MEHAATQPSWSSLPLDVLEAVFTTQLDARDLAAAGR